MDNKNMIFEQELKNNKENKNFEKDMEDEEKLLLENKEKFEKSLADAGGKEELQEKIDELGDEKIKAILNKDVVKKGLKKAMEIIGYAAVSPAFASVTYLFAKLYNSSNSGEPVNPLIIAGITALSVALVEISAIRSANKEKKEKEFGMRVEA